jgi:hypothetical protein
MLAYRKSDFDALAARAALEEWTREGILDPELSAALSAKFPSPFHSPHLFIRIGLFLFGSLCAMASLGLLAMMFNGLNAFNTGRGFGILLLVFAAGLFSAAESLVRKAKPYFRAGLEEAFLYGALLSLAFGIYDSLYDGLHVRGDLRYPVAFFLAGVVAAAALRYADSLLAAVSLALCGFALFGLCSGSGEKAAYIFPCAILSLSALVASASGFALARKPLRYWDHLWSLLRLLALLTAYAGGNYFVVRELGHALFQHGVSADGTIPYAPLFYLVTFGLPPAYLIAGLVKKDRLFLNAGLITAALAVLTYKYYHRIMSVEMGLVSAGLFLIASAWIALRLLRKPRYGLSAAQAAGDAGEGILDAESLAMLHGFASKDAPPQTPEGLKGGGGGFGGGGASGRF